MRASGRRRVCLRPSSRAARTSSLSRWGFSTGSRWAKGRGATRTGRPGKGACGAFCWIGFRWSLTSELSGSTKGRLAPSLFICGETALDQVEAGEEVADLEGGGVFSVGAVDGVVFDGAGKLLADRSLFGVRWI